MSVEAVLEILCEKGPTPNVAIIKPNSLYFYEGNRSGTIVLHASRSHASLIRMDNGQNCAVMEEGELKRIIKELGLTERMWIKSKMASKRNTPGYHIVLNRETTVSKLLLSYNPLIDKWTTPKQPKGYKYDTRKMAQTAENEFLSRRKVIHMHTIMNQYKEKKIWEPSHIHQIHFRVAVKVRK